MKACARSFLMLVAVSVLALGAGQHADAQAELKGQRIFFSGHSFHYFMPRILADMAEKASIKDHKQVGLSAIGASRVYQHWNVPDEKNKAKEALKSGNVDVFTMAPIFLPDDGIEKFVKLAVEHNPRIRIFVQENWLPWDHYDPAFKPPKEKVDHNKPTAESLRKMHEPYFKSIEDHVAELNKKYKTNAVRVAPIGQAVIKLRETIIDGKAPGLKTQNDLFYDALGHVRAPAEALVAYCYYGLIYEKSPVGLPVPAVIANAVEAEKLNRHLQEIAWDAVTSHPMSGVSKTK